MGQLSKKTIGLFIDVITDYHSNGSYETLKNNVTLMSEENYAVMIRTLNFERNDFEKDLIFVDNNAYKHLKKSEVYENDILMNKIADPGSVYIMPNLKRPVTCGMNLFLIRFNKEVNQRYMFYCMKANEAYIKSLAHGTTTKTITKDDVRGITLNTHDDLTDQNRIAKLLTNIDKKIEINKAISAELEKLAKTLYDYWFVQFDFLNAKGKPYRASGGKMEYSEVLKREIPKGWEVASIKDITKIVLGGTPDTKNKEYWGNEFSWLNSGEIANFPVVASELMVTQKGINNSATKLMPKGTTVISITGNIRASILGFPSCANQSVVGIYENDLFKCSFFYPLFSNMLRIYTTISTGNCQMHINKGNIEDTLISKPPEAIIKKYDEILMPIYKKIINIALETKQLSELRDFLLPLLMNGQVRVGEKSESLKLVSNELKNNFDENKYQSWLAQTKLAARGNMDEQTLRKMFEAMDEDDR